MNAQYKLKFIGCRYTRCKPLANVRMPGAHDCSNAWSAYSPESPRKDDLGTLPHVLPGGRERPVAAREGEAVQGDEGHSRKTGTAPWLRFEDVYTHSNVFWGISGLCAPMGKLTSRFDVYASSSSQTDGFVDELDFSADILLHRPAQSQAPTRYSTTKMNDDTGFGLEDRCQLLYSASRKFKSEGISIQTPSDVFTF